MPNERTREEEEAAFIQSLKALISRTVKETKHLKMGDVISALEYEKFSCIMHHYLILNKKDK